MSDVTFCDGSLILCNINVSYASRKGSPQAHPVRVSDLLVRLKVEVTARISEM